MGPTVLGAATGLIEAAMLFIAGRRGFDEDNGPGFVFLAEIQAAVRISERAFAEFFFVLPFGLAGFEVLTGPAFAVGVAINEVADFNHATVMVNHDFIGGVNRGGVKCGTAAGDFEKIAAGAIAGSDINETIGVNRSGNDRSVASPRDAPKNVAIGSRNADDALGRQLDVLANAADVRRDERGIVS